MAGTHKIPPKIHAYSYPHAAPGFAESDLDEYDKISAGLAWSRSLNVVRKAFEIEVDLEGIWEEHSRRMFFFPFRWMSVSNHSVLDFAKPKPVTVLD